MATNDELIIALNKLLEINILRNREAIKAGLPYFAEVQRTQGTEAAIKAVQSDKIFLEFLHGCVLLLEIPGRSQEIQRL